MSLAHPNPKYRKAIPSGNSGAITSVIRDADCFEQMTGTEPKKPGYALHKTGKGIATTTPFWGS
ncbi:MAG: hypothetical protein EA359_07880 [Balneolaceae bacterium]|nr:MAG: hypothetical protein EA359_07880 [Balneolaceae bacterium]